MQGGREGRDLDATELAQASQALGAGELLLNCIDRCGLPLALPLGALCASQLALSQSRQLLGRSICWRPHRQLQPRCKWSMEGWATPGLTWLWLRC